MDNIANSNPTTITVIANGQPRMVQVGSTITDLLKEASILPTHVVVQLNGVIIERSQLSTVILQDRNELEIVTLVGGG
jgi:thiamine biosynthesis protein ThiS